jgi:hypothetical protein
MTSNAAADSGEGRRCAVKMIDQRVLGNARAPVLDVFGSLNSTL